MLRALAIVVVLLALPAPAADISRAEVEAALGAPVDSYSPAGELGLPYRADVVAVSWVVRGRAVAASLGAKPQDQVLTTCLFTGDGRLIEARQQKLGDLDAPVHDVTQSLRRILLGRRT